jgi:predicted AAA+ superfamily ATPase
MMIRRPFWIQRIEKAWEHRSIVWLAGVRRSGKTVLCQSLSNIEYFDCELPRIRRQMEDPEAFLSSVQGKRIVLDEAHRLPNPSELLKIAADHFPAVKIIATASSSLHASRKFRDTLTGRKVTVHLTPMNLEDVQVFGGEDLSCRLLRGGLPPFFLSREFPERDFQEWMDSYWAKDIQELFRLERRAAFQRFLELLFVRSGGIFEATAFAAPCEVSRTTILNYLNALELTCVCDIIRPFSTRKSSEIIAAPKIFVFDTGFISYYRGWRELRPEDKGILWEHMVLNEIRSCWPEGEVRYWRDKFGHEVDFILLRRGRAPVAVECKWSLVPDETAGLAAFRRRYPQGENWMVAGDSGRPLRHKNRDLIWESFGLKELVRRLAAGR